PRRAGSRKETPTLSCAPRQLISGRGRRAASGTGTAVIVPLRCSSHFLLENLGEAVETLLRRYLSHDGLLNERHAIGVDPAAPPRVDEVRADDRERERCDEAAQRRIVCKLRLREDGLAGWQQPQRLAIHQAGLVIEHEAHELPRALLVAAALERGERLGEIKGRALLRRTERQRHRSKVGSAYVLLLLANRARIVLVHAGDAASECLDDLDEAIGCSAWRCDLVLERKVEIPGQRLDRLFRVDRQLAVV